MFDKHRAFLNYCRLYIFQIYALGHAILDVKIGALFCCFAFQMVLELLFLCLLIRNIYLGHLLYNKCTILWPTKWYSF